MDTHTTSQFDSQVSARGNVTCGSCGKLFVCGVKAGGDGCWCFELPNIVALDDLLEGGHACLCPACLRLEMRLQYEQRLDELRQLNDDDDEFDDDDDWPDDDEPQRSYTE